MGMQWHTHMHEYSTTGTTPYAELTNVFQTKRALLFLFLIGLLFQLPMSLVHGTKVYSIERCASRASARAYFT
eukprot:COSAG02_NODE_65419_length_258_cov_0.647799_1_plen_72_part_10